VSIKKIIREEIESSDWDWVKEVPDKFQLGNRFNDDEVCFDSDNDCVININKDNITFVLDWDWWVDVCDVYSDNAGFLETLFYHGRNFDGNQDFEEVDTSEFNYSHYNLTDEQKERLQNILNVVGSDVKIDDYASRDDMLSLSSALKYKPLREYYNDLIDNYLTSVGYAVQRNRWLSIADEFGKQVDKTKSKWSLYRNELTITIPMDVVWEIFSDKSINNLSNLLFKVSSPITDQSWYDWFYEEWDYSGSEDEMTHYFNKFLDNAEEFLNDDEEVVVYRKFHNIIDNLGFKPYHNMNTRSYYLLIKRPQDNLWTVTPNYNTETALLELKKGDRYSPTEKSFEVPFDEIPTYLNNYLLDL
jgi:hypothetical protein